MNIFLKTLYQRNPSLTIFGWICFVATFTCFLLVLNTEAIVLGINAWIKPAKFFLSSGIFAWTMAWILNYLQKPITTLIYSSIVILVLSFETIYISLQASKGELSHFNISSPHHAFMFGLMGIAIVFMVLCTVYICFLFFKAPLKDLPRAYVWGLRLGILIFVIFSFEGGMMASRLAHTVGAADSGEGLPLLNWSKKNGDLRIAHFIGMHALQLIPLSAYYVFKKVKGLLLFASLYFFLCWFVLFLALSGSPLF